MTNIKKRKNIAVEFFITFLSYVFLQKDMQEIYLVTECATMRENLKFHMQVSRLERLRVPTSDGVILDCVAVLVGTLHTK